MDVELIKIQVHRLNHSAITTLLKMSQLVYFIDRNRPWSDKDGNAHTTLKVVHSRAALMADPTRVNGLFFVSLHHALMAVRPSLITKTYRRLSRSATIMVPRDKLVGSQTRVAPRQNRPPARSEPGENDLGNCIWGLPRTPHVSDSYNVRLASL